MKFNLSETSFKWYYKSLSNFIKSELFYSNYILFIFNSIKLSLQKQFYYIFLFWQFLFSEINRSNFNKIKSVSLFVFSLSYDSLFYKLLKIYNLFNNKFFKLIKSEF